MLTFTVDRKTYADILSGKKTTIKRKKKMYDKGRFQFLGLLDNKGVPTSSVTDVAISSGYNSTEPTMVAMVSLTEDDENYFLNIGMIIDSDYKNVG